MSDFKAKMQCTKIVFGWGSAPDPAGGAYDASPNRPLRLGGDRRLARPFSCLRQSPRFAVPSLCPWRRLCLRLMCKLHKIWSVLIVRIIIKIDATRCQILRLKCTKIVLGWGSAPDPAGGAYDASPNPLVGWEGIGAWRVHSCAFGTPLDLPYHLYVRGAASVCVYCVNCTKFGQ